MGFFHFSVSFALLTSRVSSLLWEFTNSLICNYGSLHLSSKNLEFFRFTQTNLASLINKPWVFQVHSYCVFRSPEKLKVFWFETPNLFFVHRKNKGFLIREAKLQPLLIYEIDCHSALHNLMFAVKTIEKTEQNTSSCKRMYFELQLKKFLLYFRVSNGTFFNRTSRIEHDKN